MMERRREKVMAFFVNLGFGLLPGILTSGAGAVNQLHSGGGTDVGASCSNPFQRQKFEPVPFLPTWSHCRCFCPQSHQNPALQSHILGQPGPRKDFQARSH